MASKHEKTCARAVGTMLNAIRNFVECPDPADGTVDEDMRMMNRCEAAATVVADLPAVDTARVLAHAVSAIEEDQEDGDGCLSMLAGEAIRLRPWTMPSRRWVREGP